MGETGDDKVVTGDATAVQDVDDRPEDKKPERKEQI